MSVSPPTVVICCYSDDRFVDSIAAVDSARVQTLPPHEIIVSVDNNAALTHRLRETLPSSVQVVQNTEIPGLSETRNVAVRLASSEIIAFLDDDAKAEPEWLASLTSPFEQPDVMAVGGQSKPAWELGHSPIWFPTEFEFVLGCTGHLEFLVSRTGEVRNVTGSNMAFRKRVFEVAGEWRWELGRGQVKTGGEEAELCLRVKSVFPGSRILFEPSAVVHHKVSRDRSTLNYVVRYCYNEGVVRAMLSTYTKEHTGKPLAGEWLYLRRLIDTAIPNRLKQLPRLAPALQLTTILANTALLAGGYVRGRAAMAIAPRS